MHRRLAQLERSLLTNLFVRSPRGYALTAAGQELLAHVQAMDKEVLAAERRVGGRELKLEGRVHLSTVDDLAFCLLGPILRDFTRQHEAICVDMSIDSDFTNLARREADVAIRPGTQPVEGDLIGRRVGVVGVALYASQAYLKDRAGSRPSLASLGSLRGHRIVRADDARSSLAMEQIIDRHAPASSTVFRSNSMLARLGAVRDGLGIGFLPCFAADAENHLVRLGDVHVQASAELWILVHADLRRNARVRAFVEHVHQALDAQRARLAGG